MKLAVSKRAAVAKTGIKFCDLGAELETIAGEEKGEKRRKEGGGGGEGKEEKTYRPSSSVSCRQFL